MEAWQWFLKRTEKIFGAQEKGPTFVPADDVSPIGALHVATWEQFKPKIYLDQGGRATIGFGHLLLPGEAETFKAGLTREQAISLLYADLRKAVNAVNSLGVGFTQCQFDALVSFTFNVGPAWTRDPDAGLRQLVLAKKFDKVPEKMKEYNKVTDKKTGIRKVSKGLVNRRKSEAQMFSGT